MFELTHSQQLALDYITHYAKKYQNQAQAIINHVLKMSHIKNDHYEKAINNLKTNARIALHFHPDRLDSSFKSVAEALYEQGVYKNQFETFISNGKVSPHPGGKRDLWENKMFGEAYQFERVTNVERPKYGALNLMLYQEGPAPRFGSCYFLLSPQTAQRSTFTYLDSHREPFERGTYEAFQMILAAILEDAFSKESVLGVRDMRPTNLIEHILINFHRSVNYIHEKPGRNLDQYIEAQVHGDVSLQDDVEVLIADPSYKGEYIGAVLESLCEKYAIELNWHKGFVLKADDVPSNFRGPSMQSLAQRISENQVVHARAIGQAVNSLHKHPKKWTNRGTAEEVHQELKYLWHVLVRFGKPYKT